MLARSFPLDPTQSRNILSLIDKLEDFDELLHSKEQQVNSR